MILLVTKILIYFIAVVSIKYCLLELLIIVIWNTLLYKLYYNTENLQIFKKEKKN